MRTKRSISPIRVREPTQSTPGVSPKANSEAREEAKHPFRHLALLAFALLFGGMLGALSISSTSSTLVAPPHSKLRFGVSKMDREANEPGIPAHGFKKLRRWSFRRLRFTKL